MSSSICIEQLQQFMANIENERVKSMSLYHAGKIQKPKLDKSIQKNWIEYLKTLNQEIFNTYLQSYE
jgi:hypothetical protein